MSIVETYLSDETIKIALFVVFGKTFADLVSSLVFNIIIPVLAGLVGSDGLANLTFNIGKKPIYYGKFLDALIYFLVTILILYFLFLSPMKKIKEEMEEEKRASQPVGFPM